MNIKGLGIPSKDEFMSDADISNALYKMEGDPKLNTKPSLISVGFNNFKLVAFHEYHTKYLREHPKTNPANYLANLKTMLKER